MTSQWQSSPGRGNTSRYTMSKFKEWKEKASVAGAVCMREGGEGRVRKVVKKQSQAS